MRLWMVLGLVIPVFHAAYAAKIASSGDVIALTGQINAGDAAQFAQILPQTNATPHPILFLNSIGGRVIEAIRIGEMIRDRGIYTAVIDQSLCASACGLIWVAGQARFADHTSRVGFHAAYTGEATDNRMDGAANALIGSYLAHLGLSDRAIYFATSAPPDTINWLPSDGSIVEIPYKLIETPLTTAEPQPVAATPAQRPSARPPELVASTRMQLMKPNTRDYVYPHELVASEPFKRAYIALFTGRNRPEWLLDYQTTHNGVEMPVWSTTAGTKTYQGFRVCQPNNCNDTWIDVVFADYRAYGLTWKGGKPIAWWGQPDSALQQRLLNEGEPSATPPAMSTSYDAGRQTRIAYETWFNGLVDGPFKEGAQFWAANRSLKQPPDCQHSDGIAAVSEWGLWLWRSPKLLTPADLRRKVDPDFRWGWNSL